jgi:UDP-galactopyranose mutase
VNVRYTVAEHVAVGVLGAGFKYLVSPHVGFRFDYRTYLGPNRGSTFVDSKPVVSTPIKDVVRHYGQLEGVKFASTAEEFVDACEQALELLRHPESGWLAQADLMLSATSWDTTQARMGAMIDEILGEGSGANSPALLVDAE